MVWVLFIASFDTEIIFSVSYSSRNFWYKSYKKKFCSCQIKNSPCSYNWLTAPPSTHPTPHRQRAWCGRPSTSAPPTHLARLGSCRFRQSWPWKSRKWRDRHESGFDSTRQAPSRRASFLLHMLGPEHFITKIGMTCENNKDKFLF